jgi:hypothetical protein
MDLAAYIVDLLHPYLGVLLKAGVGALGKDIGQNVSEAIRAVWNKLGPAVTASSD